MSQFDTATEELSTLLATYFPRQWMILTSATGVSVFNVDDKHLVRALELLSDAMDENDPDEWREKLVESHREGYEEAENEFKPERIELEEKIEDLEAENEKLLRENLALEEELETLRLKVHVSNEDEE